MLIDDGYVERGDLTYKAGSWQTYTRIAGPAALAALAASRNWQSQEIFDMFPANEPQVD